MSQPVPTNQLDRKRRQFKKEAIKKLVAHRGMATWGERIVPLSDFRLAAESFGTELTDPEKEMAIQRYRHSPVPDSTPVEGPFSKIVVFGGVYSNSFALQALLKQIQKISPDAVFCLGDLGGFGPHPEKIWPLLVDGRVHSVQGNYEESLASGKEDCNCGYADPRDNHYAEISYRYTSRKCSPEFKRWMGSLPKRRRVRVGQRELLLVHGSPRRINEFLFKSATSDAFLEVLLDQEQCDGILCTHTGLYWHRRLPSGRDVVNVGVIGRPANDGRTDVWFCLIYDENGRLRVEFLPLAYNHQALVEDMRKEQLPEKFVETIVSGWWTTCLEILPSKERGVSRW